MYKIFYNDTLFFQDNTPADEYKLVDTTLSLAANSAGNLSFLMPIKNKIYDSLQRMRGLVKVRKNDRLIWEGRVLSENTDFWKNKDIYCEGIMSCLNDTRQPQHVYKDLVMRQYVEAILSIHNQKVDADKKFELGIVTVASEADLGTRVTNYESTWEIFKGLIEEFGGYLFVRYANGVRYLDYRSECPRTSTQKIEFGVNLLDFTRSYDMSSLCTVLLPLGKTLASAGSSTVGDTIDAKLADGHYIAYDEETDNCTIYYDPNIAGSYAGSNTPVEVEAGKTYYISCRNNDGRVMWALWDASGNLHSKYEAGSSGFTDLVEYKLEIPQSDVENTYRLAIAGFGADIQPRINESIEADEAFDKYVTVEEVNNGSVYVVNEEAVTNYGWIEKQLTWSNIEDAQSLKDVAETYLREGQFDEMSLEVSAVDLQAMGVNADYIDILDEVQVVSEPHGLNKVFPVTELIIKMDNPSANKFTLGSKTEQTLSGVVSSSNDELFAKINSLPSMSAVLASAQDNATQLINTKTSGIFSLEYDENGNTTGFRISNVADWSAEGAKGWRFTMGGLGYFPNGFNSNVRTAITGEDGGIVANCVTTGNMLATRIRGGTLGLGHYPMGGGNYLDGKLEVMDGSGNVIVNMGDLNGDGSVYGAIINGEFTANGNTTQGPRVVHIKDGWITGSDTSSSGPSISVDTVFGGGIRGASIEGNIVAIVAPTLYVDDNRNAANLRAGISAEFTIEGNDANHTLKFCNGVLVDWEATTE